MEKSKLVILLYFIICQKWDQNILILRMFIFCTCLCFFCEREPNIQALAQCELTLNKLGVAKVTADDTAGAAQVTFSSSLKPDPYST